MLDDTFHLFPLDRGRDTKLAEHHNGLEFRCKVAVGCLGLVLTLVLALTLYTFSELIFLIALLLGRSFDQFAGRDISRSLFLSCGKLLRLLLLLLLSVVFGSRKVGVAVSKADATGVDLGLVGMLVLKPSQLFFANCLLFIFKFFLLGIIAGFCFCRPFVAFILNFLPSFFLGFALFGVLLLSFFSLHYVLLGVSKPLDVVDELCLLLEIE